MTNNNNYYWHVHSGVDMRKLRKEGKCKGLPFVLVCF